MVMEAAAAGEQSMMEEAVGAMSENKQGYDVVVVCTSNQEQEDWWQSRLDAVRGQVMPESTTVMAVHEDWDGGAGNALGTLYAYTKAAAKAKAAGMDLEALLSKGSSVALYHTAGKGTRLAPLPGSENNNKPGVRLPAVVKINGKDENITILESVIKQTGLYAAARPGRLSVYWGDQVFIPSVTTQYKVTAHADLLCKLGPMMTKEEWESKGMHKYGLVAVNNEGSAVQVEKVDYESAVEMMAGLGEVSKVGVSLGSFSVSASLLEALLAEFKTELDSKTGKFDSDPHLWMPLTLSAAAYKKLMGKKGVPDDESEQHHDRMQKFKTAFFKNTTDKSGIKAILGGVDVGIGCYWWDYGQLAGYVSFNKRVRDADSEAEMMRRFFNVSSDDQIKPSKTESTEAVAVDEKKATTEDNSIAQSVTTSDDSTIIRSVLSNVKAGRLDVEDSMLVGVTAKSVRAKGCLLYNVSDENDIVLPDNSVRADVYMPNGDHIIMTTTIGVDSGKNWKVVLEGNVHSFEDVYKLNQGVDVVAAMAKCQAAHAKALEAFSAAE